MNFFHQSLLLHLGNAKQLRFGTPSVAMESVQLRDDAVKCVVVGDSGVGKTRLICARASGTSYTLRQLMHTHVPTVWAIDHYRNNKTVQERSWCTVDGVTAPLCLWDTFGYHDKDRQFAYGRADVVLICFSLVRPRTLQNVMTTWYSEVQKFCPGVPVILCGCQADLRYLYQDKDFLTMDKGPFFRDINDEDIITPQQGRAMAKQIGAPYYETSVLTNYGIEEVFLNVVRLGLVRQRGLHFWNALSIHFKKVRHPSVQKPFLPPKPKMPVLLAELPQMKQDMRKLLSDSNNSDIMFVAQDKTFHAHKACLIAASDIFDFLQTKTLCPDRTSERKEEKGNGDLQGKQPDQESYTESFTCSYEHFGINSNLLYISDKCGKICPFQHEKCELLNHPVFVCRQNTLEEERNYQSVITLRNNISAEVFKYVLEFLYTGCCEEWPRSELELLDIRQTADLLKLPRLVTVVNNVMKNGEYLNHDAEVSFHDSWCERARKLLLNDASFSDVEFQLEDGCVAAHKSIVMSRSDVLKSMFSCDFRERSAAVVALPSITTQVFLALLEYLYTDRCPDLNVVDSLDVLEIANCYCLPRLVTLVEEFMVAELQQAEGAGRDIMEDVLMLVEHAQLYNAQQMAQWCLTYLSLNYAQLYQQHAKLLHRLQPHNQVYLSKHRWPPVWYIKEIEYYEKRLIDVEREGRNSHNFRALRGNCMCFCKK